MKDLKINVLNITETSYEDGTCWAEYYFKNKLGYFISSEIDEDTSIEDMNNKINGDIEIYNKLITKKNIKECGEYLASIIEECRQSENEMWFVEYEDLNKFIGYNKEKQAEFLEELEKEVSELKIEEYIIFHEGRIVITVYGGVITKFLF